MRLPAFTDLRESVQFFLLGLPAVPLCVAAGVLLGACSAISQPIVHTQTPNGPVTEHPGAECPDPAVRFGCTQQMGGVWHIYYPAGYPNTRAHEWDHAQGLRHGGWSCGNGECCATVVNGGHTAWATGTTMCTRRSWDVVALADAPYYEAR